MFPFVGRRKGFPDVFSHNFKGKVLCGATATIGVAVGLDPKSRLIVEVFPVNILLELDDLLRDPAIAQLLRRSAPNPSSERQQQRKEELAELQTDMLVRALAACAELPELVCVVCHNSQIEVKTSGGKDAMMLFAQTVRLELRRSEEAAIQTNGCENDQREAEASISVRRVAISGSSRNSSLLPPSVSEMEWKFFELKGANVSLHADLRSEGQLLFSISPFPPFTPCVTK